MIDLIKELEDKNIRVSLKNDQLVVNYDGEIDNDLLLKLKANKTALINFMANYTNIGNRIVKVDNLDDYPISHAQKRLWIESQIEDKSKSYHICNQMYLKGDIDVKLFESSVFKVIQRHEILRTVFKLNDVGEVRQRVLSEKEMNFKVEHLDLTNDIHPTEKAEIYILNDNEKIFDLENGPLLRIAFLKLDSESYLFYYNMHHIITDGWSLNVLEKDLFRYYDAMIQGVECDLENLPIQYKDYAVWQLSAIDSGAYQNHRNFWSQKLSGDLPRLNLPMLKVRSNTIDNSGCILKTTLSVGLSEKIKQFSAKNGGSLFMGLVSILKVLLYKYTSERDLIIGTAVAGREDADLENQIGFYVNTVVLRDVLQFGDNFTGFFKRVKQSCLEAFSHQIYPFDLLISDLDLFHINGRNYIFDIIVNMYNFSNINKGVMEGEIVTDETVVVGRTKTNFDLEFIFDETQSSISFMTIFNTSVYDEEIVRTFMNHFQQLAVAILEDPNINLENVTYLSKSEKDRILLQFNETDVPYSENLNVIKMFESQTEKTPKNFAVEFEGNRLSYSELNAWANALASYLKERYYLEPDDFVGIKLERSEKLIASILAILKCGSAYIPIDLNYPKDRIDYIERNSNCKLILDDSVLNDFYSVRDRYDQSNILTNFSPVSAAYAIYTSGSTGTPKGVVINHSSLMNYVLWAKNYYSLNGERTLDFGLFTSLSFDLTVTSLFLPLITGGLLKVFTATDNIRQTLINYLESGIKNIKLTPSHIRILDDLGISRIDIELAIVGGEPLLENQVKTLRKLNPTIRIINEYGPTEATVGCTVFDVTDQEILIGKPIANTRVYILDEALNLCGLGVTGEIYLSGAGLARGYLNQKELTETRFVSNPFLENTLMYKTGDIGRWLPGGFIEYVGRIDDQVKIRGYRIELGEIETALSSIDGVKQSVVAVKPFNDEFVLAAYYVSDTKLDKSNVYLELNNKLPKSMLPEYYIQIDDISLTTNGKVDRNALPDVFIAYQSNQEFVTPSTILEIKVAEIWKKILGLEKIDVNDNFFTIGGQSIKAIMVASEIKKELNVNMNLESLFINNTIKLLAREIDNRRWLREESNEMEITDKVIV